MSMRERGRLRPLAGVSAAVVLLTAVFGSLAVRAQQIPSPDFRAALSAALTHAASDVQARQGSQAASGTQAVGRSHASQSSRSGGN